MVRTRDGRTTLGCLFLLLLLAAVAYFAFNVGEVYVRFYRYQDAMRQEARFAAQRTDAAITRRLEIFADSIGLTHIPKPKVRRRRGTIEISNDYTEFVEVPLYSREIEFHPRAQGTF